MKTAAVVVAGGRGKRMGGPMPKQFLSLRGKPLLYYAVKNIADSGFVDEIVLVVPEEYIDSEILQLCIPNSFSGEIKLQTGGSERQYSVLKGLEVVSDDVSIVLVHDGVRPFLKKNLIGRCIAQLLNGCDGVIPIIRVKDTLKEIENGLVKKTLDREKIAGAQTPQVFRKSVLIRAYDYVIKRNIFATDDAFVVEVAGGRIEIVEGDELNIKITSPSDLAFAEWVLERGFFDGKS